MAMVADLVVRALSDAGVRMLFGVPGGGSNLDLIAAARRCDLPFVLTASETAAAIAAIAQAEVTGAPGACLTTLGPGAMSVVNGVACAFLERAPLVVFTDSHPASAAGGFAHQRVDHRAVLQPVTKSSQTLTTENALEAVTSALCGAVDGQPGPVHLDCPGDVAAATALAGAPPIRAARPHATCADRSGLDALLARSRKPLVIAGMGARLAVGRSAASASNSVRRFCNQRRVPALVTYKAKGVVPDDDPWFAGVFTNGTIEQPIIDESDLLLGIGLDPVELIPRAWSRRPPIVYVGPWAVEQAHVPFEMQLVGDLPGHVAMLDGALRETEWDERQISRHVQMQRDGIARPGGAAFTAQQVVEIAVGRLAARAVHVTVDAGAHMFPVTMLWPVREPHQMLISNGLSTMGFALPAAIGAALLARDSVVALTGDGGLLMCLGELSTAARERLRIVTIVFSDGSLSLIEIKQQARRLESSGVTLGAIDWPSVARGLGVRAWSVSAGPELGKAIDAALAHDGPTLIEARIVGATTARLCAPCGVDA